MYLCKLIRNLKLQERIYYLGYISYCCLFSVYTALILKDRQINRYIDRYWNGENIYQFTPRPIILTPFGLREKTKGSRGWLIKPNHPLHNTPEAVPTMVKVVTVVPTTPVEKTTPNGHTREKQVNPRLPHWDKQENKDWSLSKRMAPQEREKSHSNTNGVTFPGDQSVDILRIPLWLPEKHFLSHMPSPNRVPLPLYRPRIYIPRSHVDQLFQVLLYRRNTYPHLAFHLP